MGDVFGLQIVIVGVGACVVFDVWQRIFNGLQQFRRVIGQ